MKQFKRGYLRCKDCQADMTLETLEAAELSGRTEPHLVCPDCGSTAPWEGIADKTCNCGATPVQREFALSAPDHGLRLYVTELTELHLFHQDGRGLVALEACTSCTDCFVCKEPILTQECVWDEIPLEGLQNSVGLTHQYVYLHPECSDAYDEWRDEYLGRIEAKEAERARAAERREYCIAHGLCLECEKPLGLVNRFIGRLRHPTCPIKLRPEERPRKQKKSGKMTAKRPR